MSKRIYLCAISLILLLPLIVVYSPEVSARPLTGYCSSPHPHCYGDTKWYGNVAGAYTRLEPYGTLNCQGCGNSEFITEEMWFSDTQSASCSSVGGCWIEMGVATYNASHPNNCHPGYNSICVYWADNRPGTGLYHEHPVYNIGAYGTSLDPYLIDVKVHNATGNSNSGSVWNLNFDLYINGSTTWSSHATSTNNQMSANRISVGSEVSSSKAYKSSVTYYDNNQWGNNTGGWNYQTNPGSITSDNPPTGYWYSAPCNCSGNTGGAFETYD